MLGCVSELQTSMGVATDVSPAWIMAAAKHFAPRLDTLCHIFLLQPQLASDVSQQRSKEEPTEMVRISFSLHFKQNFLIEKFVVWEQTHQCFFQCQQGQFSSI